MAQKKSGIEALLEALKQSGEGYSSGGGASGGGGGGGSSTRSGASEGGTSGSSGSSTSGGGRADGGGKSGGGFGGIPGIPQINFPESIAAWGKRALIIFVIVLVVALLTCYWWFHPPISINSPDTWFFGAIFILLPAFVVCWTRSQSYAKGGGRRERDPKRAKNFKYLSWIPLAVVAAGIIGSVASQSFIPGNAERYANVLQTSNNEFAQDIQEVDYSEIPVIDRDSAVILGDRAMGSIPDYVSQFEISPLYSQINYREKPTRVSPLVYEDVIKWFNNREAGIPAYVQVDMTTQDTEIVRLGDHPIKYSQAEPLFRNIDRHVQLSYPFYIFDEKSFEIDDDGRPWWICPVRSLTIGLFGGETISRVVMVDATTGECTDLPVEEVPQWVDRVYPAELLITQYNWSGALKNGWINSWWGQQNVVQVTPGTNNRPGYNYIAKDDDVWVYTGVTSATADSSIVGFVLVNQRTAESHFYEVAGATEESGMSSAEGQVQHLGYSATFPLLINVAGQPTYFMALKDAAGLVKQFAMLDIERYQNVSTAETVGQTQSNYEALLVTNGVIGSDELQVEEGQEASGTIAHIAQAVIDGNTHFYLLLEGSDMLYEFPLPGFLDILSYRVGDRISFTYQEGESLCLALQITGGSHSGSASDSAPAATAADNTGADAASGDASADSTDAADSSAPEEGAEEDAGEGTTTDGTAV